MKNYDYRTGVSHSLRWAIWGALLLILAGCGQTTGPTSVKTDTTLNESKDHVVGDGPAAESAGPTTESAPSADPAPKSGTGKAVIAIPAFLDAALEGKIETVRQALEAGMNVNAKDDQQRTALLLASFNGHTSVVKLLLEQGASLDQRDAAGRTALMFASTGANPETVALLCDAGSKIDAVDSDEGFTALMYAAAEGQAKVVEVLMKHKADPAIRDADGDTAKDFATQNGHFEVVRLLTK